MCGSGGGWPSCSTGDRWRTWLPSPRSWRSPGATPTPRPAGERPALGRRNRSPVRRPSPLQRVLRFSWRRHTASHLPPGAVAESAAPWLRCLRPGLRPAGTGAASSRVAAMDHRLSEVHPEASFRAMSGEPLAYATPTWNGRMMRRRLPAERSIDFPDDLGSVPVDDLLDAAAWSGHCLASSDAFSLPDPPQRIGGRDVAMCCRRSPPARRGAGVGGRLRLERRPASQQRLR